MTGVQIRSHVAQIWEPSKRNSAPILDPVTVGEFQRIEGPDYSAGIDVGEEAREDPHFNPNVVT